MLNYLKKLFKPNLQTMLYRLEWQRDSLIKDITNGRKNFSDNEKMIEFFTSLTEKLVTNYKVNGELNPFEVKVLDYALKEGMYRISFLLLSDIKDDENIDTVKQKLILEGFKLIETVGYVNIDKIVHYIEVPHSF